VRRLAEIGCIEERVSQLRLIEVDTRNGTGSLQVASACKEPEPVLSDRTAQRAGHVVQLPDGRRNGRAARAEAVIDVVALQLPVAEIRQDRSLERVAAILRNEIELKPRADGFGCQPSYHLNDDFLRELRIDGAVQIAG